MTDEELRELIRNELEAHRPVTMNVQDVVRTAVQETLITLGMDASDPLRIQKDMAFLRDMRQAHGAMKSKGILVLVGLAVSGAAAAAWVGIKAALHS